MDYSRVYREFIEDRKLKQSGLKKGNSEVHHIKPRSIGGGEEKENKLRLNYSDHLFAHLLLAKIHGGKLLIALFYMLNKERYKGRHSRANRVELKQRHISVQSKLMAGNTHTLGWSPDENWRKKKSASMIGNTIWKTPGALEKRSAATAAAIAKPEIKEKIKHIRRVQMSTEEGRMKQSPAQKATHARKRETGYVHAPAKGLVHTEESKRKISGGVTAANASSWKNPVVREKRLAGMAAARLRKKEQK